MRRLVLLGLALALLPVSPATWADEPMDREEIVVPPPPPVRPPAPAPMPAPEPVVVEQEEVVAAPPPPRVELRANALAAGIGFQWGRGTLNFDGRDYGFRIRGISAGDVGLARSSAIGGVENLERIDDFAGRYVALEAGVAAGVGRSAIRMRNRNGVVIHLDANSRGGRLTLGAEGLLVELD